MVSGGKVALLRMERVAGARSLETCLAGRGGIPLDPGRTGQSVIGSGREHD